MLTTYLISSSVTFLILFCVWDKKDEFNLLIKLILLFLSLLAIICTLSHLGFIVRP